MTILMPDIGGKGIIMAPTSRAQLDHLMAGLRYRNPAETEFHSAAYEGVREWIEIVAEPVGQLYD